MTAVASVLAGCVSSGHVPIVPADTLPGSASRWPTVEPAPQSRPGTVIVRQGDSLYAIARANGVPLRGLIDANRLRPPYLIHPGQRLALPGARYHVVSKSDTIYGIAERYGIDMGALVRVNRIPPPYRIVAGDRLRLPDVERRALASKPPPTAPSVPVVQASARQVPPKKVTLPPPRSGMRFLWPIQGKIISGFGKRGKGIHNDGINIAAREGTPVHAAENGVIAYAGNQLTGFGNLLLIRHADGWMSAYAHGSVLLAKRGDVVRRGQVIAKVGRTGDVARPQLHFELRRGDEAVDPRGHLTRTALGESPVRTVASRAVRRGPE